MSKTCKSLLKWLFDKLFAKNQFWQKNFNSLNCMRLNFYLDCEEHIFDRISRNTYPNWMGLVSLWSRSKNLSYELKLIFSSFCRNFIDRAQIWGCPTHVHQIHSLRNHESHQDVKPSSYITHLHTQAFRKISQVVIFKLSSCDSSPPPKPVTGESSNVHKMSYTHPNLIPLVAMGSRRQEEEMKKDPFWDFQVNRLWRFNF